MKFMPDYLSKIQITIAVLSLHSLTVVLSQDQKSCTNAIANITSSDTCFSELSTINDYRSQVSNPDTSDDALAQVATVSNTLISLCSNPSCSVLSPSIVSALPSAISQSCSSDPITAQALTTLLQQQYNYQFTWACLTAKSTIKLSFNPTNPLPPNSNDPTQRYCLYEYIQLQISLPDGQKPLSPKSWPKEVLCDDCSKKSQPIHAGFVKETDRLWSTISHKSPGKGGLSPGSDENETGKNLGIDNNNILPDFKRNVDVAREISEAIRDQCPQSFDGTNAQSACGSVRVGILTNLLSIWVFLTIGWSLMSPSLTS